MNVVNASEPKPKFYGCDVHELINQINAVIEEHSVDPVEELHSSGEAMMKIAEVLRGRSRDECRSLVRAVAILHGVDLKGAWNER